MRAGVSSETVTGALASWLTSVPLVPCFSRRLGYDRSSAGGGGAAVVGSEAAGAAGGAGVAAGAHGIRRGRVAEGDGL